MEDITDADYAHAKRVCKKEFSKKSMQKEFRRISWFVCQSNIVVLADVFENFRNMCLNLYEFNPQKFLSALGLAWHAALKITNVKLILKLLLVEKV